ncbi:MAG TPA: S24 family peptidase [Buttiauxella sp.]|nr:S24 family peptidase [Buttiauxella sp.]
MAFPSPALDYEEQRISLDAKCIVRSASTYIVRCSESHWKAGIMSGAYLVVDDSAITPCDGSIVVATVQSEFRVLRYKTMPKPQKEEIDQPGKKHSLLDDVEDDGVFGVATWILNDARSGEFDDVPVM